MFSATACRFEVTYLIRKVLLEGSEMRLNATAGTRIAMIQVTREPIIL